ncbi:MAG: STAS domain-containing protein [Vicinamibacterales bacterium]
MQILVHFDNQIPVLALSGRFDADGAHAFDEKAAAAKTSAPWWVLDMSEVSYLSSIGLRSLVMLEKTLRGRSGGLMLAGTPPLVAQVLRVSKLDGWIRAAATVEEALAAARAATIAGPAVEHRVGTMHVRTRRLAGDASAIEWWDAAAAARTAGTGLIGTTLAEIGFAVGRGGFGATVEDARTALGAFVSTPLFAGVLPDGSQRLSDFVAGGPADDVPVHVAAALGVSGAPSLVADVTAAAPFEIAALVDGLFESVAAVRERMPAVLCFVVAGDDASRVGGVLAAAVAFDPQQLSGAFAASGEAGADAALRLAAWPGQMRLPSGRAVVGGGVALAPADRSSVAAGGPMVDVVAASATVNADLLDVVRSRGHLDALRDVVALDAAGALASATVWIFEPRTVRNGAEKQLQVTVDGGVEWRAEWDAIVRRLYADCRSVALSPLHGGYMSKTFRVVGYDAEGRRTLPTVLKIGSTELTAREERANREYVARFILNNGTTVLGGAQEGAWAGLRYNFLGVNGPDSRLVWLREHYLTRPPADVLHLYRTLFTQVLKPWYGQPKWEQVSLYRDHTPLRLFPNLVEIGEEVLGVSADEPVFHCEELGVELPNPYWFLKHEYPARASQSRLWYTTVCHGDLNMQNVLVDERENIYVIDFSETRSRNAVSDFARIEPILKFELIPIETDDELRGLIEYEAGLTSVRALSEAPPFNYPGGSAAPGTHADSDGSAASGAALEGTTAVGKAHALITLLRQCADTVTLFEEDMVPYWLALLEWTYSPVCYVQLTPRQKRYAACSAALICRAILEQEARHAAR